MIQKSFTLTDLEEQNFAFFVEILVILRSFLEVCRLDL